MTDVRYVRMFALSLISSTVKFIMTKTLKNVHSGKTAIKTVIF